ncbi:MAG: hypothetical protein JWL69_4078 [Phycisphaerales bacterium]|nr:hypothetical protein [Phycisphaerales bacterium]MDB5355128.1 hypothetical protein [Phycisphaerales bacterium]
MIIRSILGQRLQGLFLVALSTPFIFYEWNLAANEGYYRIKAAVLFPAFAVGGLGLILFPIDYKRLKAEHGIDRIALFRQYPLSLRIWTFVTLAAALGNWWAIDSLCHPSP